VQAPFQWPFVQTDDGLTGPHVHQRTSSGDADRIVRCRLDGTKPVLEGRLGAAARASGASGPATARGGA
jgi:hypothetical protein